MSIPYNARMSVTSVSEVRYEGFLVEVNAAESTVTLSQARSFGTEGRISPLGKVLPESTVYEKVTFRGSDIKELKIISAPTQGNSQADNNTNSRVTSLAQSEETQTEVKKDIKPFNAIPSKTISQPVTVDANKTMSTSTTSPKSRRSVFDSNVISSATTVVTVEGLGRGATPSQVLTLFKDENVIQSVKIISLPLGKTAADVVFRSKVDADKAIADFDHGGLNIHYLDANRRKWDVPKDSDTFGTSLKKTAPPVVRDQHNQQQQNRHPHHSSSRGGKSFSTTNRQPQPKKDEPVGSDFDFSASNARFEKEKEKGDVVGDEILTKKSGTSSFFDSASFSTNAQTSNPRVSSNDIRKKNAETFGAVALSYRGGSLNRNRGGGTRRGGTTNNRNGGRGGYSGFQSFANGGQKSVKSSAPPQES